MGGVPAIRKGPSCGSWAPGNPLESNGFAGAFAGLTHAAALALGTHPPRFPVAPDLPGKNRDRNGRVPQDASRPAAPEALSRAQAACATMHFVLVHGLLPLRHPFVRSWYLSFQAAGGGDANRVRLLVTAESIELRFQDAWCVFRIFDESISSLWTKANTPEGNVNPVNSPASGGGGSRAPTAVAWHGGLLYHSNALSVRVREVPCFTVRGNC